MKRSTSILSLLVVLCTLQSCLAFNPSWFAVGGFPYVDKYANLLMDLHLSGEYGRLGRPHEAMTEKGVKSIYAPYFGIAKVTSSMDTARQEIMEGTMIVDQAGDAEALMSEAHCDDEQLEACSQRLIKIRQEIPKLLAVGQVGLAREKLGRALHTLQDFYSHSNWVELKFNRINSELGQLSTVKPPKATPLAKTCRDCEYTGGDTIRDAYILATDTCRKAWVDKGGNPPFNEVYNKLLIMGCMFKTAANLVNYAPFTCANNLMNPFIYPSQALLTSGYFGAEAELHSNTRTVQKCNHGGPFDRDAYGREGISKDTESLYFSPKPNMHRDAVKYAEEATVQYLNQVKDEICQQTPTKACAPLRLLYGVGPILSFVIDTTTSMSSIIAAVRQDAIKIVNDRRGTPDEPSFYVLSQINDPDVPDSTVYTDTDSFISAISALSLLDNGNSDCPELGMLGISKAINATPEGGLIFVWTDAATKNPDHASFLVKDANKKNQEIIVFQFQAGCTDSTTVDRKAGYDKLAANTLGALFPDLSRSEAGNTAKLAASLGKAGLHKILTWKFKKTVGIIKRDETHTVNFPVDSSVDVLEISITGVLSNVVVTRPDGSEVGASDGDLTQIKIATGLLDTIDKPAVGQWAIKVQSSDDCSVSVRGRSAISFSRFDFVAMQGGTAHDGWFKVKESPTAGTAIDARAIIEGDFADANFEFRSPEGNLLSTIAMESGSGEDDFTPPANYFWGAVTIPNESFNIYITGKDPSGSQYQRLLPGILDITFSPDITNTSAVSNTTTTPAPYANATSTTALYSNLTTTMTSLSHTTTLTTSLSRTTTFISKTGEEWSPWISEAETTRCQTLMYYSSWQAGDSWSTSLVTTTIEIPCWEGCATALPVISPACTTLWAGSAIATSDADSSTGWGSWNSEASAHTLRLPSDETSSSSIADYPSSEAHQSPYPSDSQLVHTEQLVSMTDESWPTASAAEQTSSTSYPTTDPIAWSSNAEATTRTSSSPVGLYTGESAIYRPSLLIVLAVFLFGFLFGTF